MWVQRRDLVEASAVQSMESNDGGAKSSVMAGQDKFPATISRSIADRLS